MPFILENAIFTQHFAVSVTSSKTFVPEWWKSDYRWFHFNLNDERVDESETFVLEWWKSDWKWNVFTWMMKEWVRAKCVYLNDERVTESELFLPEWWKSDWKWTVFTWMMKEWVRVKCLHLNNERESENECTADVFWHQCIHVYEKRCTVWHLQYCYSIPHAPAGCSLWGAQRF